MPVRRKGESGVAAAVAAAVVVALAGAAGVSAATPAGQGAAPAVATTVATTAPAPPLRPFAATAAYQGLGAWLDVFDTALRRNAAATVERFQAAGVSTVFLETSSWSRPYDVQAPELTGPFLDAAHAAGLHVVAWYLPGFQNVTLDVRRALAAVRFRSATGGAFDGLALDIEDSTVADAAARTRRLLVEVARVRAAAPRPYALGAIVPAPLGLLLRPSYWPGFPWAQLAASLDAFVPMIYSSYRTLGVDGVFGYTVANVALLRALVGDPAIPVHVVGGVASSLRVADVDGFVRAAQQQQVAGASLYDAATTRAALWPRLAPLVR